MSNWPPEQWPGLGSIRPRPRRVILEGRWFQCPVCAGNGIVPRGFYMQAGMWTWTTSTTTPEPCRSCEGAGVLREAP